MWSPSGVDPGAAADTLARVAAVLLVASLAGRAFQRLRLPRISGYLLTGAVLGPRALAVLRETHAARLAATDTMCLAVIGIAAGAELQMADLRRHPRPTLVMTACVSLFSFAFVFLAFLVVGPRVAFLAPLESKHVALVGSLLGTLAIARSPASAIAVLREMDAKGPFCQHVISVTVAKDFLVVALFALNVEFAALANLDFSTSSFPGSEDPETRVITQTRDDQGDILNALFAPVLSVAAAVLFGVALGAALGRFTKPRFLFFAVEDFDFDEKILTKKKHTILKRSLRAATVALASGGAFALASKTNVEPLLLCVVAGATCANRRHAGGAGERETLFAATSALMPVVNLVFFTAAGSSVRFDRVFKDTNTVVAAIALFLARLFALFHATAFARDALVKRDDETQNQNRLASTVSKASSAPLFFNQAATRDVVWMAMITQAGVAMGLVKSCERRFASSWGGDFAALAAATIVLNLLAGPPAFRHAIVAAGESGAQRNASGATTGETVRTVDDETSSPAVPSP